MGRLVLAALIGLWVAASGQPALGQAANLPCSSGPSLSVRELSQNGAVVRSGGATGLGYVVGWRKNQAWVAVPAHVVFGEGVTPHPEKIAAIRPALEVRLFGDTQPRPLCDEGPTPPQGVADLSFICVQWLGRPFLSDAVLARRVKVGDELRLVDFQHGQQPHGSVTKVPADGEVMRAIGDIEARELSGVHGQSGALTANAAGVAGLYLGRYTGSSILSMSAISTFAGLGGVPWSLIEAEYYDCTASRSVCLTVKTEIAPPSVSMRSIFSPGSYLLERDSCAALPEGRYEVLMPPSGLTCEPRVIAVYSEPEDLRLDLQCSVALMGTWRTEDGDNLLCVELQMGSAQCSGLGRQGLGLFSGRLSADRQGFSITGSFFDPAGNSRAATGSLRWTGGALVGEIRRHLEPSRPLRLKRLEES